MNLILNSLSFVILLHSCCFLPFARVEAQCLSNDDDLSKATDTDLSSIQDFNIDLFKRLVPKGVSTNFVFSPYSVWNSLILAYFGSAGETEKQFQHVLKVEDKISTLRKWRQLEYMYLMRPETSVNNTFVLTNRVYFDVSVRLSKCMENILHNELKQLDFSNDPTGSANTINKFVFESTRGHIDHLVNAMDIMFAHLVLVNAAFFKGHWVYPFDPNETETLPFTTLSKKTINVPMMSQFGRFRYSFDDKNKFSVLELPYVGETIAMYIFLPEENTKGNFDSMVISLTKENLNANMDNMLSTQMTVLVPKFSLKTVIEDELLRVIYKMGLTDAFTKEKANFTDYTFNRNIKLDRSIHKAFIEVNEEGTEAAASTGFIANKIGGNSKFNCNRPFLFIIRDNQTKNLLFMGILKEPQGATLSSDIPSSGYTPKESEGSISQRPSSSHIPKESPGSNSKYPYGSYAPKESQGSNSQNPSSSHTPRESPGSNSKYPSSGYTPREPQGSNSYNPSGSNSNYPSTNYAPKEPQGSNSYNPNSRFNPEISKPSLPKESTDSNKYPWKEPQDSISNSRYPSTSFSQNGPKDTNTNPRYPSLNTRPTYVEPQGPQYPSPGLRPVPSNPQDSGIHLPSLNPSVGKKEPQGPTGGGSKYPDLSQREPVQRKQNSGFFGEETPSNRPSPYVPGSSATDQFSNSNRDKPQTDRNYGSPSLNIDIQAQSPISRVREILASRFFARIDDISKDNR